MAVSVPHIDRLVFAPQVNELGYRRSLPLQPAQSGLAGAVLRAKFCAVRSCFDNPLAVAHALICRALSGGQGPSSQGWQRRARARRRRSSLCVSECAVSALRWSVVALHRAELKGKKDDHVRGLNALISAQPTVLRLAAPVASPAVSPALTAPRTHGPRTHGPRTHGPGHSLSGPCTFMVVRSGLHSHSTAFKTFASVCLDASCMVGTVLIGSDSPGCESEF